MSVTENLRDKVNRKLGMFFGDDADTLMRIMFYLNEEETIYDQLPSKLSKIPPVWRTLRDSLNSDNMFSNYAQRLAEDTKRAEKDVLFRKTMSLLYDQLLTASEDCTDIEVYQQFDGKRFSDLNSMQKSGLIGFAKSWSMIPVASQEGIINLIKSTVGNRQLMTSFDEVVGLINKTSGNIVMVVLAAVFLTYDVVRNINLWWQGQISGKRCCKNIIDTVVSMAASVAGGVGGAMLIGSIFGPVGTLIGGIVGGIISGQGANYLSDLMTQKLFGLPKEVALENAFNFFGLKMSASNHEINTAFRHLCLKHHPDKGGKAEDFYLVQINMQVIKSSKEELI